MWKNCDEEEAAMETREHDRINFNWAPEETIEELFDTNQFESDSWLWSCCGELVKLPALSPVSDTDLSSPSSTSVNHPGLCLVRDGSKLKRKRNPSRQPRKCFRELTQLTAPKPAFSNRPEEPKTPTGSQLERNILSDQTNVQVRSLVSPNRLVAGSSKVGLTKPRKKRFKSVSTLVWKRFEQ